MVVIFCIFIEFYYRFHSPQVKQNLISSITNLVYELPNELRNNLRFEIFRKFKNIKKSQIFFET